MKYITQTGLIATLILTAACSQTPVRTSPVAVQLSSADKSHPVEIALQQVGAPYRYGGHDPSGFDCSGLVYYAYLQQGIKIPRTTRSQLKHAKKIPSSNMRYGDLVFFKISRSKISHVGIYIGDNKFVHAPSKGKSVSISSLDTRYWQKRFVTAARI
jgi:cell wall-associated NlpC family hydrolase